MLNVKNFSRKELTIAGSVAVGLLALVWGFLFFSVSGDESASQVIHTIMDSNWNTLIPFQRYANCESFYNPAEVEYLMQDVKFYLLDHPQVAAGEFGYEAVNEGIKDFFEGSCEEIGYTEAGYVG